MLVARAPFAVVRLAKVAEARETVEPLTGPPPLRSVWKSRAPEGAALPAVRVGVTPGMTRRALDAAFAAGKAPATPAERAAADAARIEALAQNDPVAAAEELDRCVADNADPAYRAALLADPATQRALRKLGAAMNKDPDTARCVAGALARASGTLRASGQTDVAQDLARGAADGLAKDASQHGSRGVADTMAFTVEGGGADFVADLTVALAETPTAHSAALQQLTRDVATGLSKGIEALGAELDARSAAYDAEVAANAAQEARYGEQLTPEQRAAASDSAAQRTGSRASQADASGEAYYRALEAASRARDALHANGKGAIADGPANLDGILEAGAARLDDITRFPAGAAAVGATLRREQAGERTLVDALDRLGLDEETEAKVFAGLVGAAAFNGAQDAAAGGDLGPASDQVRDLGRRFLPAEEAEKVDRIADRIADGTLLTAAGMADLNALEAEEPFASNTQIGALFMGMAGAALTPEELVAKVQSGEIPPRALQEATFLMGLVAMAEGLATSTVVRGAGTTATGAAIAAEATGAKGAAGWLRGLGTALGGAGNVLYFLEAAARGDDVGAAIGMASILGMLPGLTPIGWVATAAGVVLIVGRYVESRIEREEAENKARIRYLTDAGVPCARELANLPDGGVGVLGRVQASGPHADLEAAIRAELAAEYEALAAQAAAQVYGAG